MKITQLALPEVLLIIPDIYSDQRGYFYETYSQTNFKKFGLSENFVQDNLSYSFKNVLRGLHFQKEPFSQGKLVRTVQGKVYDVAVDIRPTSPTFQKWVGYELSETNHAMLYIPPGFAHGFCVLSESALFEYKCTANYHAQEEGSILWNDPELNIQWPIKSPILSSKDAQAPLIKKIIP